jgi:flagellar biosynthesis protein FliR
MRYRQWLLVAAAASLFFGFVFVRLTWVLQFYPMYGDSDIHSSAALAIALLLGWLVLEVVHYVRTGSRGVCECGYSLRGVKCPECGRDIGAPPG